MANQPLHSGSIDMSFSTAIGIMTKEGVVLAAKKLKEITSPPPQSEYIPGNIMLLDQNIGCAISCLNYNARDTVLRAQFETLNRRFFFGRPMTFESIVHDLSNLVKELDAADEESMSNPFAISLLIAGHDEKGPSLCYIDQSGTSWACTSKAIGVYSDAADKSLKQQFNEDLTLKQAETMAVSILKEFISGEITPEEIVVAKVSPRFHLYTNSEVEEVINSL